MSASLDDDQWELQATRQALELSVARLIQQHKQTKAHKNAWALSASGDEMPTDTLTDALCKRAVAAAAPVKLFDGHGLYLFVTPASGKRWRMTYRVAGKPQTATFATHNFAEEPCAESPRQGMLGMNAST